jgi:hypothetical protein
MEIQKLFDISNELLVVKIVWYFRIIRHLSEFYLLSDLHGDLRNSNRDPLHDVPRDLLLPPVVEARGARVRRGFDVFVFVVVRGKRIQRSGTFPVSRQQPRSQKNRIILRSWNRQTSRSCTRRASSGLKT